MSDKQDVKICVAQVCHDGYHFSRCGRTARYTDKNGRPACGTHRADKPATAAQIRAAEKRLSASKVYEARRLAYAIADLVVEGKTPSAQLVSDYAAARNKAEP